MLLFYGYIIGNYNAVNRFMAPFLSEGCSHIKLRWRIKTYLEMYENWKMMRLRKIEWVERNGCRHTESCRARATPERRRSGETLNFESTAPPQTLEATTKNDPRVTYTLFFTHFELYYEVTVQ